MIRSLLATFLLFTGSFGATAEDARFHAGVIRATVVGEPSFDSLYWYPTPVDETPWQAGPFTMPATRNAPVADGKFPLLLLSHGGGLSGGTPLLLRELAANLARRGFVVVAPFHGKSGFQERSRQMKGALDAVRADPRLGAHTDASKIGMVGFSLGTAVTLQLAGAVPNPGHLAAYCAAHAQDVMSCSHAPDGRNAPDPALSHAAGAAQPIMPPLKAIALLDPYAVLFQRPELEAVTMPVLIFRPEQSALPAEPNVVALTTALPRPPDVRSVPGGHFVFVDVCPDSQMSSSGDVCKDPPGVDRTAVHRAVEAQLGDFFRQHL
ncbi:alpha/beta hydrolase family protein [Azorhizobium doebereinerae]|uniref:alpha/beta hydrolase family protein n=1 Tax=Azorhizobium doebereinerae TaxID=281091 RepID=UPI0006856538|nr:alpha/beta hydrolase [Azorhizobium doebereinerae]